MTLSHRRWLVGFLTAAGVLAGGWAVHAAPGMPGADRPTAAEDAGDADTSARAQVAASEQAVLSQANAQGAQEIAALKAAQARIAELQTQLQQATAAEQAYRQAALQATARAQQLAAQLQQMQQTQAQPAPARHEDDEGHDD